MRRREFISLIGGAAATWPIAVHAQQSDKVRLIGVLSGAADKDAVTQKRLAVFRDGLAEVGWIEGRNVRFQNRWSGGDTERMHSLAAELSA
jgi:putative ABC transport system substrate-binding protein